MIVRLAVPSEAFEPCRNATNEVVVNDEVDGGRASASVPVEEGLDEVIAEETRPSVISNLRPERTLELAGQLRTEVGQIFVDHVPRRLDELFHSRAVVRKSKTEQPPGPSWFCVIKPLQSMIYGPVTWPKHPRGPAGAD